MRITILLLTISPIYFIFADSTSRKIPGARELLSMQTDSAFQTIHKLSKEETAELITQIRLEARKDYKDIDKFYLLISHLESIKAIEEEEKRLRDLNLVYVLGLVLVVGLIGYTLFAQRKSVDSINQHLS